MEPHFDNKLFYYRIKVFDWFPAEYYRCFACVCSIICWLMGCCQGAHTCARNGRLHCWMSRCHYCSAVQQLYFLSATVFTQHCWSRIQSNMEEFAAELRIIRSEQKIAQKQMELFQARLDLFNVTKQSAPAPEHPRAFNCPFQPCLWSCVKCSASSGIHHMKSCLCRPVDYHYQVGLTFFCFFITFIKNLTCVFRLFNCVCRISASIPG